MECHLLRAILFSTVFMILCMDTVGEQLSDEECSRLGFKREELTRKRCIELEKFGLASILESCLSCIKNSKVAMNKRYSKARLEVCECNLANYEQIQAFVRSDRPKQYENLSIKWIRGVLPTMKLLDDRGNVIEQLSITKWDTDTITEFLDEHIKKKRAY